MTNEQVMTRSEFVEWDDEVTSLGRRVRACGAERWIVQFRVDGRMQKRVIGDGRTIVREDARRAAILEIDRMRRGEPMREALRPPNPFISIADFGARFLADLEPRWKPATRHSHGHACARDINPILGSTRVADLTREGVIAWRDCLTVSAGTINRSQAVLSGMMRHAETLGLRPPGSNPCKGLRRRKSGFEADYLSGAEYRELGAAFRSLGNVHPTEIACLWFIALTGCRKSEARTMQWDWVARDCVTLPESKTGPKSIWLGIPAVDLLKVQERRGPFVFGGCRQVGDARLSKVWDVARQKIGKPTLRIHDLRHSFASMAVNRGEDLGTIGGLLGHSDLATTAGYAHLIEAPVAEAAERVGTFLSKKVSRRRSSPKRRPVPKPKPAPAPKPAPVAKPVEVDPNILAFLKSAQGLPAFCEERGLCVDEFRRSVVLFRSTQEDQS